MSVDMVDYMVDCHHIDIDPSELKKVKVILMRALSPSLQSNCLPGLCILHLDNVHKACFCLC
jgi:hypothetical protein